MMALSAVRLQVVLFFASAQKLSLTKEPPHRDEKKNRLVALRLSLRKLFFIP